MQAASIKMPPETSSPRWRALSGQLGAVGGVGAVAAEAEEAVEAGAGELDVGGGLDVAGDEAEQKAVVDQAFEQLLDSRHHPVAVGLGDGVGRWRR